MRMPRSSAWPAIAGIGQRDAREQPAHVDERQLVEDERRVVHREHDRRVVGPENAEVLTRRRVAGERHDAHLRTRELRALQALVDSGARVLQRPAIGVSISSMLRSRRARPVSLNDGAILEARLQRELRRRRRRCSARAWRRRRCRTSSQITRVGHARGRVDDASRVRPAERSALRRCRSRGTPRDSRPACPTSQNRRRTGTRARAPRSSFDERPCTAPPMLSAGWFSGSRANADGCAICTPTT